jgi:uncharacterized protein (TIGR03067 family)
MKTISAAILLTSGLLLASGKPKTISPTGDVKALQGAWRVVKGESKGKAKPEDASKDLKWVIKGTRITLKGDEGKSFELRFQIDAAKKPKTIDLTNPERKETVQGIYQLDGDTWKLCVGVPGEKRPTAFVTRENLNVALFVLQRDQ